ncbi:MAG: hypothetical protein WDO74_31690 [Pseudomonadota bacterium]
MQTRKEIRHALPVLSGALLVASFVGCFSDPSLTTNRGSAGMSSVSGDGGAAGDDQTAGDAPMDGDAGATAAPGSCRPVKAEPLPQRSSILSNTVVPSEREVFIDEIWTLFSSQCKGCHVDQAQGNFQVTQKNYATLLQDKKILERLTSEDLSFVMPPTPAKPYSTRPDGDPVRDLVKL